MGKENTSFFISLYKIISHQMVGSNNLKIFLSSSLPRKHSSKEEPAPFVSTAKKQIRILLHCVLVNSNWQNILWEFNTFSIIP